MKPAFQLFIYALAFFALGEAADLLGCPMCRDAVDQTAGEEAAAMRSGLASGFAVSIYIMLLTPFLLIVGFAAAIRRNMRRANTDESQSA